MHNLWEYELTKSDNVGKVPLLAYFVNKIIDYNKKPTEHPPVIKKSKPLMTGIHMKKHRNYYTVIRGRINQC